jgi:hypothetical protein
MYFLFDCAMKRRLFRVGMALTDPLRPAGRAEMGFQSNHPGGVNLGSRRNDGKKPG